MTTEFNKNLPKEKKAELKNITKIILANAKPELIILFGSYARGDFVEYDAKEVEGHIESYASDFDIFVIVRTKKEENAVNTWHKINEDIGKLLENGKIKTPFNIIPESISHVEEQLDKKRSFYTDLVKDGVLLFSSGKIKLELREGELSVKEKKAIANENFDLWFKQAKTSFEHYDFSFNKSLETREHLNKSAFELHQTAENLFTALLLVFNGYKPKTHDLEWLLREAKRYDKNFKDIFPRKTKEEKRLFNLLKRAYVDARYSKEYKITKQELKALAKQVKELMKLTKQACKTKIKSI